MPLHYAVLASVSGRYSPLRGRLLTCYSPVRHFMHSPKGALIVRLACLRHAASVDSEPGSNSRWFPSSFFGTTNRSLPNSLFFKLTHGLAYLVFKYQPLLKHRFILKRNYRLYRSNSGCQANFAFEPTFFSKEFNSCSRRTCILYFWQSNVK